MGAEAGSGPLLEDFGPYRFIRVLGAGGLATVYLVEDTLRGFLAVMKVGRPELDSSAQKRFHAETSLLAQFRHPNVPRLHDFGNMPDGRPFLVTEWLDGSDLATLLATGESLSIRDVLLTVRSVAGVLDYAHERRILHLDVKPANILVPKRDGHFRFDEVKLIDFSVRGTLEPDTGSTRAGSVVGTPYYMSPEQLRGDALTPAADVFSLGVVMYEMLSGGRPFESSNAEDMFLALLSKQPAPLGPAVPQPIAKLVLQCLAKDPRERPASGARVLALLEPLLNTPFVSEIAVPGRSATLQPAEVTGHGWLDSSHSNISEHRERLSSPRLSADLLGVAAAVAIALAIAVGLALATIWRRGPSEWLWVGLGLLLILAGLGLGGGIHQYLASKRHQLTGDISALLGGAQTRKALSLTLSVQVDEVIKKCRLMDEKFLGLTMALMVKEYDSAKKFDDRQKALMNAIAILDKLGPKLAPWYLRHEKLIAAGVSLAGVISGLATAAVSVMKLIRGTP